MSFYYQEKVVQKRMPFLAALLILAVVLLMIAGAVGATALSKGSKAIIDTLLLAFYGLSAFIIIKSSARKFKYCLMQEELIIREMNHRIPKIHNRIHLDQIRAFQPMPFLSRLACIGEDDACPMSRFWRITYEENGKVKTRIIHPSNSLAEKIRQRAA